MGHWEWTGDEMIWVEDPPQPDPFQDAGGVPPGPDPYTGYLPYPPQEPLKPYGGWLPYPPTQPQSNPPQPDPFQDAGGVPAGGSVNGPTTWTPPSVPTAPRANAPTGGGYGGGGGGGGGGGPAGPDLSWMDKFGGKDFIKLFLKRPGEKLKDYYARMGGDPVKTLIQKYQELEGFDPDMNMRSLALGALGLTGIIDPNTLEEIFAMPDSDYLGRLMKAGPSMAGLTRQKLGGVRTLRGNDWWSMSNSLKNWAPTTAAAPPTTVPT